MLTAEAVLKRHGELKALRAPHETQWREIARLMLPEKEDMFTGSTKTTVAEDIYDATQMQALESFSGGIFGQLGAIVGSIFGTGAGNRRGRLTTGQVIARDITRSVTNQVVGGVVANLGKSVGGKLGSSVGRALVRGALGGILRR